MYLDFGAHLASQLRDNFDGDSAQVSVVVKARLRLNSLTIKNHDLLRFSKAISERLTNYSPLETDPTLQLEPCR